MALPLINVGRNPNDGNGDPLEVAFVKINALLTQFNGVLFPGLPLNYVAPIGGQSNDLVVPGLDNTIGRLFVTLPANANWTGLKGAGVDGQPLIIVVMSANVLTLNANNASSQAANQFQAASDAILAQYQSIQMIYTVGSVNRWVMMR